MVITPYYARPTQEALYRWYSTVCTQFPDLPLMALGGAGFISALSNIAPQATSQMYDLWVAGQLEEARQLHFALHPLVELLFIENLPSISAAYGVLPRSRNVAGSGTHRVPREGCPVTVSG